MNTDIIRASAKNIELSSIRKNLKCGKFKFKHRDTSRYTIRGEEHARSFEMRISPNYYRRSERSMKKKNIPSIVLALILIATVLLGNSGGMFVRSVQALTPPSTAWSQHYGSYSTDEKAYSVVQTSDGGYALAGTIYSYPNPPVGYDALLVKTDASGTMQWNKTYGGSGEDQMRAEVQTGDGGYALAGYTNSYSPAGDFDFWLVRTDSAGNLLWSKTYGTTGVQDYAYSMVQTSDGGYALAGYGGSAYSAMLVKTDSAGNLLWTYYLGAGSRAYSLVQTNDGGYALAGSSIWKTDSANPPNQQWNKALGDPEALYAYSIVQTSDGGYAYAGDKRSLHVGNDIYLVKTDSAGNLQWVNSYGGDNDDSCSSVVQTSDGGYVLAGRTQSYGAGNWDFYLVKADSNGVLEWQKTYGGAFDDGAYCVIETSDGGLALAGYSHSYTNGGYDMWLVKVSAFLPLPYNATIWSWDSVMGWVAEPITMDGVSTGFSTPHTFKNLVGTHSFKVPDADVYGTLFGNWTTGEKSTTITVSSGGTYTAQYYALYAVIVTNVVVSKTVVGQGSSLKINVTVTNQGSYAETFNVTVDANTTIIATKTVALTVGNSTTITFTWNTALAYGNRAMSALVTLAPGETNKWTGPFKGGTVLITILGDCNGDKTVNVLDMIQVALHLGHGANDYTPYSPDWYKFTNADLNNDGKINVLDLIKCALHMGQHW